MLHINFVRFSCFSSVLLEGGFSALELSLLVVGGTERADVAFSAAKQGPPAPVCLLPLPTGQSSCATLRPPGAAPSPPGVCLLLTPGRPQLLWLITTVLVSCSCCMEVSQIGWL